MNQEELKQRLTELLDDLNFVYRELVATCCENNSKYDVPFGEFFAENLITNGVTIRERGEQVNTQKIIDEIVSEIPDPKTIRKSHKKKWAFKKTPRSVELWEFIDDVDYANSFWYVAEAIKKYGVKDTMPILMNDNGGYHSADMDSIIAIIESDTKPSFDIRDKYQKIVDNPKFNCGWISPSGHTYSCSYMGHSSMAEEICKMFGYPIKKDGLYIPDDTLLENGFVKVCEDGHYICVWSKVNDKQASIIEQFGFKEH